jgi:AcrR family transcriptional regulator
MDWRERKKAQTRGTIRDHAMRLFAEKGYDNTTVEEIAAAAGVSHMTFFRYFPRKECVVAVDEYMGFLHDFPAGQPPLTAAHQAIRSTIAEMLAADAEAIRGRAQIILRTPELHPGHGEIAARQGLAERMARHLGAEPTDLEVQVWASTALGALLCATRAWVDDDGTPDYLALIDQAFAAVGVPHR